jgi:hypothetical protein
MGAFYLATRRKHGSEGLSRKECGEKSPSGDGLKVSTATKKCLTYFKTLKVFTLLAFSRVFLERQLSGAH